MDTSLETVSNCLDRCNVASRKHAFSDVGDTFVSLPDSGPPRYASVCHPRFDPRYNNLRVVIIGSCVRTCGVKRTRRLTSRLISDILASPGTVERGSFGLSSTNITSMVPMSNLSRRNPNSPGRNPSVVTRGVSVTWTLTDAGSLSSLQRLQVSMLRRSTLQDFLELYFPLPDPLVFLFERHYQPVGSLLERRIVAFDL